MRAAFVKPTQSNNNRSRCSCSGRLAIGFQLVVVLERRHVRLAREVLEQRRLVVHDTQVMANCSFTERRKQTLLLAVRLQFEKFAAP